MQRPLVCANASLCFFPHPKYLGPSCETGGRAGPAAPCGVCEAGGGPELADIAQIIGQTSFVRGDGCPS